MPGSKLLCKNVGLVVADKLAGTAAHTGPGWNGSTVVGALRAVGIRISTSDPVERKGTAHRLDAGTSEVMAVAKPELVYGKLRNTFHYHQVEKAYLVVTHGTSKPFPGIIDAPIGWVSGRESKMTVVVGDKSAITHYDTAGSLPGATLARVQSETGRIHQIRVHFAVAGHPPLEDTEYRAGAK